MNRVILAGNLGSDPEVRDTKVGQAMATFTLATNETWIDKQGDRQEKTEWHRVIVFGKQAEACGNSLSKGSKVLIEGRIQTSKWDDEQGLTHYQTQIMASNVTFLTAPAQAPQPAARKPLRPPQPVRPARSYERNAKARTW